MQHEINSDHLIPNEGREDEVRHIRHVLNFAVFLAGLVLFTSFAQAEGVLRFGRSADSQFLDPVLNDSNFDIWMFNNFYDTLLMTSDDGSMLEPGLATEWKISEDGLAVTLTVRDGVKFADGTPLQLSDVKWSLDRARNPENGHWNEFLSAIDVIEIVGSNQIVLRLKRQDPAILAALASFNTSIMPEKLFMAEAGSTDEEKAKSFSTHPIGTGPFVLSEWKVGSSMKLTRNPYYWAKDESGAQLPYLDQINIEIIPDDATRILKLQAGQVDVIEHVPFARVAELAANPDVNMELFPSTRNYSVAINNRAAFNDGRPNPMHDARVRQAMNLAVNKEAMLKAVFFDIGTPSSSIIPSSTPHARPAGQQPYPYDLERAKVLMAEAGHADGFEVGIMTVSGNSDDEGLSTALQQMWSKIGIKLKIELVDLATRGARYRKGDYDMRHVRWTNDINDPGQVISIFAYQPLSDSFHTGYKNEKVEKLYLATQEEVDAVRRGELFAELQDLYIKDAPIVFLVETPLPVAMRKSVTGFVQLPLGSEIFRKVQIK